MVLQYIEYIIIVLFIYLNILIVTGDFKQNIIKNKFLGFLGCLFFISVIFYIILGENILYIQEYSFINISGIFITSFLLSTFRVWGAGDAKYFFILYLFVGYISPFIYIGNIVVATFTLLLFLFIKNIIFTNKNGIWLGYIISGDIKRWEKNIIHKFQESYILGITWLLNIIIEFFLFFLFIKIIRKVFFILTPLESISWLSSYINPYIVLITLSIIIIIFVRKYFNIFRKKIGKKLGIPQIEITTLFNFFLLISISILLFFMYKDISIFLSEMYGILTIYFLIHICIRCVLYIYKKCFIEMEKSIIHIDDLKFGDYIDKTWMKGRVVPIMKSKTNKISQYTQSPDDIKEIKKLVKHHYKEEPYISIVNSFPYSPVIFGGFILTYIYHGSYLFIMLDYIKNLIL